MPRKDAYDYFKERIPCSETVECSSLLPSMLNLPSSEPLDNVGAEPIFNGMSLDDLDASKDMLRARKNERADLAGPAIAAGVDEVEKTKKLKL